jgi:DUF1365 family protein
VSPGAPAICDGQVYHRRLSPTVHEFRYPVSYVWLDPDAPEDLCRHHPLWSATRAAPAHFRIGDYGDGSGSSLGERVRDHLGLVTGHRPDGQVRMLTQVRRWGWLFNPITLYVAWRVGSEVPVGAVLEVTSTPWKERHHYAVELVAARDRVDGEAAWLRGRVRKAMHVSPFLDQELDYVIGLSTGCDDDSLELAIDVVRPDTDVVILTTRLHLLRRTANRRSLGRSLRHVAPTHRVSLGIHAQAALLWARRVPFVSHPRKRTTAS